jgi:predicted secreted protein
MSDLAGIAISITIFLVVVGYILAPVGLVSIAGVNRTAAGVTSGTTNGNMWDAFVPIILAVLVISVVYFLKSKAQ